MKKFAILGFAALLSAGLSNSSLAIVIEGGTYDGTNVGSIDNFIAEGAGQGNPQSEEDWVNGILASLGIEVEYTIKQDDGVPYYSTDDASVFAFLFDPTPGDDYFIVKNSNSVALFENVASLDWGVFDTDDVSGDMNLPDNDGDYTISHVTRFDEVDEPGGPGTEIPAPGVVALLGVGLMGMGLARTRRKRQIS